MAWQAALAGAAANTATDFLSKGIDYGISVSSARDQMEFQKDQTQEQMQFQADMLQVKRKFDERMSNTQMQRRTKDLEKAGLNRILAITQGPASSPVGGSAVGASGKGAPYKASGWEPSRSIASGVDMMLKKKMIKRVEAETKNVDMLKELNRAKMGVESYKQLQMQYTLPGLKTEAALDESKYGKRMRYINRATHSAKDFIRKR